MNRVLYRCRECFERERERTFRTISGYKSHLENFHSAKKTDLVKFEVKEPPMADVQIFQVHLMKDGKMAAFHQREFSSGVEMAQKINEIYAEEQDKGWDLLRVVLQDSPEFVYANAIDPA